MESIVTKIMKETQIISNMVTQSQITHILNQLNSIIESNIEGDIVELGCNVGTTSIFIKKLLIELNSNKKFYVYDSFEGLPPKQNSDKSSSIKQYKTGSCKTSLDTFIKNLQNINLELPIINVGWFKKIDDSKYPNKISFAFFDGDFYSSIYDSFNKIYHKLTPGAKLLVHDYGWDPLPGVEKACNEFLKDKPEKMIMLEVGIALLIKE